jgi:hypothetical protein
VLDNDALTVNGIKGLPARDLGLSLFAIPGYMLGKLDGVRLSLQLAAALLACALLSLILQTGVRHPAAVLAWAATCFSLPILHFSSVVYPELLGGLLAAIGLLHLQARMGTRSMLILGLTIGLLPLLSARYWTIAGPLAILSLLRLRQRPSWRALLALVCPPVVTIAAAVWINTLLYGLPLPNAGYILILRGANPTIYSSTTGPFAAHFFLGWAGIWLDAYWGLAATAPVLLLGTAGLPAL